MQDLGRSKQVRILLANGALVTIVFLAHMIFRYVIYDGELLPNTYYAKKGGYWRGSSWTYVFDGLLAPLFGVMGAAVGLLGLLIARRRIPRDMLCVAAMAIVGGLIPFLTGIDWMVGHRLAIPYLPVVAVFIVSGWALLLSTRGALGPRSAILVLALGLTFAWFKQDPIRKRFSSQTLARSEGYRTGHIALAKWIVNRASPGDCVVLMDIGIVGYMCIDQKILDLSGLTDRHIAKSEGLFLRKTYDPSYILDREPEFIVLALVGSGRSYTVPDQGSKFKNWSQMEIDLAHHPEFRRCYERKRIPQPESPTDWRSVFAANIGADKIFEHGHPSIRYLLVIFRRNAESKDGQGFSGGEPSPPPENRHPDR